MFWNFGRFPDHYLLLLPSRKHRAASIHLWALAMISQNVYKSRIPKNIFYTEMWHAPPQKHALSKHLFSSNFFRYQVFFFSMGALKINKEPPTNWNQVPRNPFCFFLAFHIVMNNDPGAIPAPFPSVAAASPKIHRWFVVFVMCFGWVKVAGRPFRYQTCLLCRVSHTYKIDYT